MNFLGLSTMLEYGIRPDGSIHFPGIITVRVFPYYVEVYSTDYYHAPVTYNDVELLGDYLAVPIADRDSVWRDYLDEVISRFNS